MNWIQTPWGDVAFDTASPHVGHALVSVVVTAALLFLVFKALVYATMAWLRGGRGR